jgi:lipopolysaccharide export system protein LptC
VTDVAWRTVLLIALIAVLLAAYSLWSRRSGDELHDRPAPAQAGYYLRNATVTETDATGAARFKLRANTINQNPADQSIDMAQVQLNYQSGPDALWLLTAERGHLASGSRVIDFSGNVNIKPQQPSDNRVELQTEALSIDTANNIAAAPGKVRFQMDREHLTAFGLKYDLKRQTLRLESRLHGQFQAY